MRRRFATVRVLTFLPGASPEEIESQISQRLEEAINTVEGISQLWSISGLGSSIIIITFNLERDIEVDQWADLRTVDSGEACPRCEKGVLEVFKAMQATITGWPGGKPGAGDEDGQGPTFKHTNSDIFPKRVVVFSPHPDDDVISMGGTLIRLADHGHEVHVAYQTSGNIAVFDDDAIRYADFIAEFNTHFDVSPKRAAELEAHVEEFLLNKKPGQLSPRSSSRPSRARRLGRLAPARLSPERFPARARRAPVA